MKPGQQQKPHFGTQTGNKLVLVILGISFVMGAVLTLTIIKMDISVHPSALAAPQSVASQEAPAVTPEVKISTTTAQPRIMVPLNSFVVTLNEPGEQRYLKISLSVEAPSESIQSEIELRNAELRDTLIPYLSSLSLRKTQGIRGKQRIRHQSVTLINSVLKSGSVDRVFISEFITQ